MTASRTPGDALQRAVIKAALDWYRWEKKTRVSPRIWRPEIDLFTACHRLAGKRSKRAR